jgi:hypothetical protein
VNALRAIGWRAVLVTQGLALIYALAPWLEQWGAPHGPSFGHGLLTQSIAALLVMLGALAADERIRRGESVLRAFATTLLGACVATGSIMWCVDARTDSEPAQQFAAFLNTFFNIGAYWGTPMLVYLNRKSAARLLAVVQDRELTRVRAERRLVESDLAAAQAEIDPASLLQHLGRLRDLYASANAAADRELELLISELRATAARCSR